MKIIINGPTTPEAVPGLATIASEANLVCAPDADSLGKELPGAEILLRWNFQSRDMHDQWHKGNNLK